MNNVNTRQREDGVVGIIGLGYVGLPIALRFVAVGKQVIGFDIDETKVAKIKAGRSYIGHIPDEKLDQAVARGFRPTTDFSIISSVDSIIICVPTPLNKYREPDMSYITGTLETIMPFLRKGQLICLESTTYPGTTDEEIVPRVEKRGFKVGEDVFVVFSPEREDPGNPTFHTQNTPKVVGGVTSACLEMGLDLYRKIIDKVVPVSSTRTAEMTKLLENIHRAVNIGLVNELKVVCDRMDIDIFEVINAAATKPFGFTPYYPGPGLGGHCIPIDPFYLTWKAREYGLHTRFIELAGEINESMPDYVLAKITDGMNQQRKSLYGSKILILGAAYKKNIDDMRESPSLDIIERLISKGVTVDYSDPHVAVLPKVRKHDLKLESIDLAPEVLGTFDCVVLATDHDAFDYEMILKHSKLIVDARGRYREANSKVVKA